MQEGARTVAGVPASKPCLPRLLEPLGLNRPELRAWAMYDWANSAMVCTIITAVFPIYYSKVACAWPRARGRLAVGWRSRRRSAWS